MLRTRRSATHSDYPPRVISIPPRPHKLQVPGPLAVATLRPSAHGRLTPHLAIECGTLHLTRHPEQKGRASPRDSG